MILINYGHIKGIDEKTKYECLLIVTDPFYSHGARALIRWCESKDDALSVWLQKLLKTKPKCKVITALENKLARIAWAVLAKGVDYNAKALVAV